MQSRNSYAFSAAALAIDFPRIVREADESAISDPFQATRPSVIRVTIEGGKVCTLVARSQFEGAARNAGDDAAIKLLTAKQVPVCEALKFCTIEGSDGMHCVTDYETLFTSEWICLLGDFVKEVTNRREVTVEVF